MRGKPYGNNLRVRQLAYLDNPNHYAVKYHNTHIITIYRDENDNLQCELDTGGWYTVTTKKNMNEFLDLIGYSIYQSKHVWYLVDRVNNVTFKYVERPEIGATAIDILVEDIKGDAA